jgi:putative transposase
MTFYHRNLPHWHPVGASIFLTWRLHGSLPSSKRSTGRIACATKPLTAQVSPGRRFKQLDSILDKTRKGPFWLKDPRIAAIVVNAIHHGEITLGFYDLHAYAVMPNHVHLLITPHVPIRRLTKGLKGTSSQVANSILHRKGNLFWQDESFDHWIRTSTEFDRIRTYIEFNPVSAGLVTRPQDWPWSSAHLSTNASKG